MRTRSFGSIVGFASMLLFSLNGCGSSVKPPPKLPDTVTVTGVVKLDGTPIQGAAIRFAPTTDKGFHGATGISDSAGKYELNTDLGTGESRPGVIPGDYTVFVSRLVKPDGSILPPDPTEPPMMSNAKESIPMKYSGGKLKFTVGATGGKFDINLYSN